MDPHLDALPTLTALGGAASSVQPGAWGSIRTGDINGDQRDEVLALDANGLEAYYYDAVLERRGRSCRGRWG